MEVFVESWLRGSDFSTSAVVTIHVGEMRRWIVEREPRARNIVIEATERAFDSSEKQLVEWLEEIANDVRDDPPTPPGSSYVSTRGVSVRGMEEIRFEEFGQEIRCCGYAGPADPIRAPVTNAEWFIEVEGQGLGPFMPWSEDDQREQVVKAALEFAGAKIRVPPAPWTWSVIDERGREWWGTADDD